MACTWFSRQTWRTYEYMFVLLSYVSNDSFFEIGGDNGLDGFPGLIGMKGECRFIVTCYFV